MDPYEEEYLDRYPTHSCPECGAGTSGGPCAGYCSEEHNDALDAEIREEFGDEHGNLADPALAEVRRIPSWLKEVSGSAEDEPLYTAKGDMWSPLWNADGEIVFDPHEAVLGDDLIVGGVAYDPEIWERDGEGGVQRLPPTDPVEREAWDRRQAELEEAIARMEREEYEERMAEVQRGEEPWDLEMKKLYAELTGRVGFTYQSPLRGDHNWKPHTIQDRSETASPSPPPSHLLDSLLTRVRAALRTRPEHTEPVHHNPWQTPPGERQRYDHSSRTNDLTH